MSIPLCQSVEHPCFPCTDSILVNSKGGPLAVTDANLLLGRLLPSYFPKIFGKSEKEPLDVEASTRAFEELRASINKDLGSEMGMDEVVYG